MLLIPYFTDPVGLPCESQSQISLILTEALSLEMRLSSLSGTVRCQAPSFASYRLRNISSLFRFFATGNWEIFLFTQGELVFDLYHNFRESFLRACRILEGWWWMLSRVKRSRGYGWPSYMSLNLFPMSLSNPWSQMARALLYAPCWAFQAQLGIT